MRQASELLGLHQGEQRLAKAWEKNNSTSNSFNLDQTVDNHPETGRAVHDIVGPNFLHDIASSSMLDITPGETLDWHGEPSAVPSFFVKNETYNGPVKENQ